ncbi:MAG TPA: hypothetical protein PKC33_01785, partial [Pseudomonadales bacterium]|nr:hypothetical protein [Pseudomonadales bacterium]
MGKRTVFSIVILLLAVAADARPRDGLDDPQTPPDRHGKSAARTIAYGRDALQRLDVWTVPGSDAAPLVMFVHGGGWQRGSKDNASSRWLPA